MEVRRLRVGEWITAVAGGALLVSLFLPWWSLPGAWGAIGPAGPMEAGDLVDSGPLLSGVTDWTAWQVLSVADVLLALLGVLAIVAVLIVARVPAPGPGAAAEALLLPLALVMAVVALVQVLGTPGDLELPRPLPDPTVEYGAWIGLAAALALPVGLLVAMRDERLSRPGELTDSSGLPASAPVHVETLPGPPSVPA
jgi:hypothetical protein